MRVVQANADAGSGPKYLGLSLLLKAVTDILFPPICHLCKTFIPCAGDIHICTSCREKCIPIGSPLCVRCGVPFLTEGGNDHLCGVCLTVPPPFVAARAAMLYEGSAKDLIHRLKYSNKVQSCRPLGLLAAQQLATFVAAIAPDILVPVPLHRKRLRLRCFNQAELLSEILGEEWQLPVSRTNLRRIRWTEPQVTLSAEERVRNVRGAFSVMNPAALTGKRVVLVDDVYTTGSTVAECARALIAAEVEAVYVVTVARALR